MRFGRREVVASIAASGAALALRAPLASSASAPGWPAEVTAGLVLGPGPAGRCDDDKVGIGVPRWDARRRRWLMWYYCRDRSFDRAAPPSLGTGRIALASSEDGLVWRRFEGPLGLGSVLEQGVEPEYDALHLGTTDVSYARGEWWMWCFGGNRERRETFAGALPGIGMRPGLARSPDGVRWTKVRGRGPGGACFDYLSDGDVFASWVNGLYEADRFGMFFTTTDRKASQFRSWLTWSRDALDWEQPRELQWLDGSRPWDAKGIMTRHVQRNPLDGGATRGRWLMMYTALHGDPARNLQRSIGAAVSDDLISWRHAYDEPLFSVGAPGAWDSGGVSAPQLLKVGRELRLYYFGFPPPRDEATLPKGVGLAISRSADLRGFERYRGTAAS